MTSLRRTILLRTLVMLSAVGCCAAVAAYQAALYEANQFMDDYMRQFADVPARLDAPATRDALLEPEDRVERVVWIGDERREASAKAPRGLLRPTREGFHRVRADGADWRTFVEIDGDVTRVLVQSMAARRELARHAAVEITLVIAATMLIVWLIVTFSVRRVVGRFEELGAQVALRGVDAMGPLPLAGLPSEMGPLVSAMNVLIERQGEALRRQRRFIADSAHELRTPLTALRIQIENLRCAGTDGTHEATAALQKGILRAGAMLNQLLQMARFDGRQREWELEEFDLADVVRQCVADVVEVAFDAGVDLGLPRCDQAIVRMPRADAQALVSNIVDNAVTYTPPGGSVDCLLHREGDCVILQVIDNGPGVKEADLPHLFDRFFRAAPIDKMGSGLGLAIVKAVADRNGADIEIANRKVGRGLEVRVRVPTIPHRPAVVRAVRDARDERPEASLADVGVADSACRDPGKEMNMQRDGNDR